MLGIINEPTAAAVAFGLAQDPSTNTVLVYDLGGGTFDVTVVETAKTRIRAIATGGSRELGGADWDAALRELVLAQHRAQHPEERDPSADDEAMAELDGMVEEIKKSLSRKARHTGSFTANGARAGIEISREEFELHTADLVERTLQYTDLVLDAAAQKGVRRLDDVILVGGMSRVPTIAGALHERLLRRFPDAPLPHLVDPDQIVAKGAAMYAAAAVAEEYDGDTAHGFVTRRVELVNIASRGYGIKAVQGEHDLLGHVSWLIRPNDDLPASPQESYATVRNGQTQVEIVVYESATNVLNDELAVNTELVRGMLTGLPPRQPPGQAVTVTFCLTDEGTLEILATGPSGQRLNLAWQRPGTLPPEERDNLVPTSVLPEPAPGRRMASWEFDRRRFTEEVFLPVGAGWNPEDDWFRSTSSRSTPTTRRSSAMRSTRCATTSTGASSAARTPRRPTTSAPCTRRRGRRSSTPSCVRHTAGRSSPRGPRS